MISENHLRQYDCTPNIIIKMFLLLWAFQITSTLFWSSMVSPYHYISIHSVFHLRSCVTILHLYLISDWSFPYSLSHWVACSCLAHIRLLIFFLPFLVICLILIVKYIKQNKEQCIIALRNNSCCSNIELKPECIKQMKQILCKIVIWSIISISRYTHYTVVAWDICGSGE